VGTAVGLLAIALLIAANAFFVAIEFAMVAADRSELRRRADEGSRSAAAAARLLDRLSFHLSGAQFGITVVSLGLGVLAEPVVSPLVAPLLEPLLGDAAGVTWSVVVALALTTVVQMVVGELVPKGVAVARPVVTASRLAPAMAVFDTVFKPVIWSSNLVAEGILRLFGMEPAEELSGVRSREELRRMVAASGAEGSILPEEHQLLARAFRFLDKNAADAMTPRPEVVSLPADCDTGALLDTAARTGLSGLLVHDGSIDELVGVVHVKEVLGLPESARRTTPVDRLVRRLLCVPETTNLEDLLRQLRQDGLHLAAVIDEFGSLAGVVTIEDLIEEIVGDIDDEHDPGRPAEAPVVAPGGPVVLSGRLHPDEVEDACGLVLPVGPFDTLAGFVLSLLGRIPVAGDDCTYDGWALTVVELDGRRVATVRVERSSAPAEDGSP